MRRIFFSFPGNEELTKSLVEKSGAEMGVAVIRHFPDMETFVQIKSEVKGKQVFIMCTLNHPDEKLLPLYFFTRTVKELGAIHVCLVAPYLSYMRQDRRFNPGEGLTADYFAKLISTFIDSIITVDPHLHRIISLSDIYTIPTTVLHTNDLISTWIRGHVEKPILVGPDRESEQWVSGVAQGAGAPYIVLQKIRKGDEDVEILLPQVNLYKQCTPVLVDDIISTAGTMIATVRRLIRAGMKKPVCIGIHGIFANDAYANLLMAGASEVITSNTIPHESNRIHIDNLLLSALTSINK